MAARSVYQQSDGRGINGGTDLYFLRRLSRFARLGGAERDAIHAILGRPVRFPPHGDMILEGVPTTSSYVIEEGWACSYKLLRDGKRQILAFLLPGDHTAQNESDDMGTACSVAALTPVMARLCPASGLASLRERHGRVRQALDGARQIDMATLRDHLVNIGRRNAYQRLAYLILELNYRLGLVGLADSRTFDLPITQEMIADALGLSNVHVNRTLRRLSDNNVACLSGDRLAILDRHALIDIAEFEESYLGQLAHEREPGDRTEVNAAAEPVRAWRESRRPASGQVLADAGEPLVRP